MDRWLWICPVFGLGAAFALRDRLLDELLQGKRE